MNITEGAVAGPPELSAGRMRVLADEVAASVAVLDEAVGSMTGVEAAAVCATFGRIERLAAAAKTLAAGRVAETGAYRAAGFTRPHQWLADATGMDGGDAGRTIATAGLLGEAALAPTRRALVEGSLTAAQAGEIAGAASAAPGEQPRLLALAARETAKQLRDECRKVRLANKPAEEPADRRKRITSEMRFTHRDLGDGLGELSARMPVSWLALVLAAVREQADAVFARARADGRDDPHQAYLVEALVTLLLLGDLTGTGDAPGAAGAAGDRCAAPAGSRDVDGGGSDCADGEAGDADGVGVGLDRDDGVEREDDAGGGGWDHDDPLYDELLGAIWGGPPPERPERRGRRRKQRRGRCRCGGRVAPRAKIIIRVDQQALLRGHAEGDEVCDIAGVGPVPVATVRELWPDAITKLVIANGVDVLNVTHLGRRATEALETAMQYRGACCTNIACDNDRFVQGDHRLGFANVHRTRLDELDQLCSQCHAHKTNDNWQLVRGTGRRAFVPPEHPDHPGDPPTPRRRVP